MKKSHFEVGLVLSVILGIFLVRGHARGRAGMEAIYLDYADRGINNAQKIY